MKISYKYRNYIHKGQGYHAKNISTGIFYVTFVSEAINIQQQPSKEKKKGKEEDI